MLNALFGGWQISRNPDAALGHPVYRDHQRRHHERRRRGPSEPHRATGRCLRTSARSTTGSTFRRLQACSRNTRTATRAGTSCSVRGCGTSTCRSARAFALGETRRLQFRAETFNFTNTPAFGQPSRNINSLGAGGHYRRGRPAAATVRAQVHHVSGPYQCNTRSARRVFQRLALPTAVSICKGTNSG